ncbi:uncharacterized protein LOC108805248 isoform X2 [Raphanus sativus]|uniref:Uncharacterized protein LOC108805248 isoform X2 n=1 Tax=Raphanus sativus TaxID=3726 RepID=A0A9W3BSY1_RAPSA|nr:uncharacterized protein LOC108805248 isoform X2 [Raphanus sativus]
MRVVYVAKLVNGCVVACLTGEKEREKESGAIPEEGGETVVKEEKKKNKKKEKKTKKEKKKNKTLDEKEENREDVVMDELEHENVEDAQEQELDFWMPPDGERWDFDDGGDRWGSDSEEEEGKNVEEDPIGEIDEDGKSSLDDCIMGEVDEDGKSSLDEAPERERGIKKMKLNSMSDPVSARQSNVNPEELRTTLLSRATSLSETALKVLLCRRDKLTLEQRSIEDEITKCDERIKNIKGDLVLQLETILESCNEAYPRRSNLQESHDKSACQRNKRQMKLCEPLPCTKSMCQKLDDICFENSWVLPSYHVSLSDGGFIAEVRIEETQFARTICGEEKSDAEEARESAAACLLTKLHHNTSTANDVVAEARLRSPTSAEVSMPTSTPGETSGKDSLTSLATAQVDLTAYLFLALRTLRSNLVMPYQIFTNSMLQKISKKIPRNKEELLEIDGIGEDKVSKYGDRLLETIESTIREYSLNQEERLHRVK